MNVKKPEIQDFGITRKDYDLYNKGSQSEREASNLGCLFTLVLLLLSGVTAGILFGSEVAASAFFVGIFLAFFVFIWLSDAILRFKRDHLLGSAVCPRIKLYEEALKTYNLAKEEAERQQREAEEAEKEAERQRRAIERQRRESQRQQQRISEQYWESMDGVGFERELGGLFQVMGYGVEMTPRSGDQGVDLVLRKNGVTTVVQCKAQKARASSPIARELLGSMVAFGAKAAILACTGGFTRGVYDFVEGKPIRLLDASAIAKMAEGVGGVVGKLPKATRRGRQIRREPACPKCRRQMVLRESSRGEFWGCSAYPQCRGTRDI